MQRGRPVKERIGCKKGRLRVERIALIVLVKLTVKMVRPRLCSGFDMRAAGLSHGRVIHRSADVDFLDGLDGGCGERLADGIEHGAVGLNLAADSENFSGVQREAAVRNVAG